MPKKKAAQKIIIEKTQDDSGMNFLAAIILLIIFALIIWYWGLPAISSGQPSQINVTIQAPSPSVSQPAPTTPPTMTY